jgi:hypothetical protein
MNAVDLFVHHFERSIRQTLQRLTYEVQAVSHVALLYVHWKLFVHDLDAIDCRVVTGPITTPKSVYAVELVKYRESGTCRGDRWMNEESSFCWKHVSPRSIGAVGWWIGECAVVMECMINLVNCT